MSRGAWAPSGHLWICKGEGRKFQAAGGKTRVTQCRKSCPRQDLGRTGSGLGQDWAGLGRTGQDISSRVGRLLSLSPCWRAAAAASRTRRAAGGGGGGKNARARARCGRVPGRGWPARAPRRLRSRCSSRLEGLPGGARGPEPRAVGEPTRAGDRTGSSRS